jgi:hypothetical protein
MDLPSYAESYRSLDVDECEEGTLRSSKGVWQGVLRRVPTDEAFGGAMGFSPWGSTFIYTYQSGKANYIISEMVHGMTGRILFSSGIDGFGKLMGSLCKGFK